MHAFRHTTAECPNAFTRNVSLQKKMGKRKVKGQAFLLLVMIRGLNSFNAQQGNILELFV